MAQLEAKENPILQSGPKLSFTTAQGGGECDYTGTARDARRKRLILQLVVNRLFQGPENVFCQNVSPAQENPLWLILPGLQMVRLPV